MKNYILGIFLLVGYFLSGQDYYDDAQGRFSVDLERKINKKFSVHLTGKSRLDYNMTRFERAAVDFGVAYKVTPNIKISADYLYLWRKKKDDSFTVRHWVSVGLLLKKEVRRFTFIYRNLLQARFKDWGTADDAHIWRWYDRNKVIVKYDITKRFDIFLGEEVYFPLNSPMVKRPDRARSIIGTDIKTFRNQELELYFMYQTQLQQNNWYDLSDRYPYPYLNRDFIYGVTYKISF